MPHRKRESRIAAFRYCLEREADPSDCIVGDPMPHYYFHLQGSSARDTDGQEFPNDDAARREAGAVARELSQNKTVATDDRLIVTDDVGKVIHEEPLFHR